jgi:SAM-dependent methyltransferase
MNNTFTDYRSPISKSKLIKQDDRLIDDDQNIFPIIYNIPRFVPIENYSSSFGFQWNIFNKTQVDFYNNSNISHKRFYESTKWEKEQLNGKKILEVGSGSGRFTEVILETGAEVFSLDYSTAVEANAKNNSENSNLYLCQASVYELPFEKNYFDYVCCLGVIQHTPDVELAFAKMLECLKPGGEIVIDVYADTLKTKFYSKYWFRPFTKKMPKTKLLSIISWYVPKWMPISNILLKTPLIGKFLAQIIPICNYSLLHPSLNKKQLIDWAILDTFDMLSPDYDNPQKKSTLENWVLKYHLDKIFLGRGDNGFVLIAKKKLCVE